MANTRTVEGVALSGKTRKKTSVFWSTVPEKEQFINVQVPGVAMGGFTDTRKDSHAQKFAQVVQKSKSDSAILNTRNDPLTVNKQEKSSQRIATKQNDFLGKKDASSLLKGATSSDQLANMSSLSESGNPRRASLKNLNVEDKKRVANLIKELAKTGEERELALERLQEERVSFEEQLGAIQEEQTVLKQERESLKQRLEISEKLLKKYQNELKDVKSEKEEQAKIFKKRLQAQPQGTQTSPSVEVLSKDVTAKSRKRPMKKTHDDRNSHRGRMQWGAPQVPVYSNRLFDVKVSDIEYEQNSESQNVSGEYQRSGVSENSGLHELYLREYSLQLRLQEQQIEIQRQQVQLQQQLQLLQQQQQVLPSQGTVQQSHQHPQQQAAKQDPDEHKYPSRKPDQFTRSEDWSMHADQHEEDAEQKRSPLTQPEPHDQFTKLHQPDPKNNETLTMHSPSQQTNLVQKRTSDSKCRHIEANHEADTVPHDHLDSFSRSRRNTPNRHVHVMENSRHENEAVLHKHGEPQTKETSYRGGSPPSHNHHHHLAHNGGTNSSVGGYDTSRNKGTETHHSKHRHVSNRRSSSEHRKIDHINHIDLNNNEEFKPKSTKQGNHLHDVNGNIVQDHSRVYVSDSCSDTGDQTDMEHHCRSHQPCHCGYYHEQTKQDLPTSDCDYPVSKHVHYRSIPQHDLSKTSSDNIDHHKDKPHPAQKNYHTRRHPISPKRNNSYYQKSIHYTEHEVVPPLGHHHDSEYLHHHRGTCEEHSLQQTAHHTPHYGKHKHANETAFDDVTYQASQTTSSQHEPTERRVHVHHPLDTSRNTKPLSSGHAQEYDYLPSGGLRQQRTQENQDKSKDLLDDYIHNYQTAGQYNTESNPDYPRKKINKNPTKRKTSRLKKVENDDVFPPTNYTTRRQPTYEEENPSYSLYRPNIHETKSTRSYIQERHRDSANESYPDSLVEIVEDLEVHTGYEGYSGETRDMCSTDEREYDSNEEESTILDNIFFLKR
ncbi:uncharacterized protein LOC114533759 [Dendronephthya gigantea]|uniref:uncharacterized protein LOC114533759 n=1 Tax=Dendronephthya gigantea TaxID=151771 RepID=UPI00106933CD|nr:uncharacterized protein LOC114533759 [Dendronephthya gigantea]